MFSQPPCKQRVVIISYLMFFFASVEVATYAGNIIYFRPAVLVYSLAYSYTFSVIIVFYLVVFSTKMGLLQLPVWPQRCWCFKCHISAELKWERRIVESLNLVFFFFLTTLHCMLCVTAFVCVCVRALPCHPTVQACANPPSWRATWGRVSSVRARVPMHQVCRNMGTHTNTPLCLKSALTKNKSS